MTTSTKHDAEYTKNLIAIICKFTPIKVVNIIDLRYLLEVCDLNAALQDAQTKCNFNKAFGKETLALVIFYKDKIETKEVLKIVKRNGKFKKLMRKNKPELIEMLLKKTKGFYGIIYGKPQYCGFFYSCTKCGKVGIFSGEIL